MNFPDEPNLRNVARALWQGGSTSRAALMVGAGMSRNAVRRSSVVAGAQLFPDWSTLTEAMASELYAAPGDKERRERAMRMAKSVSGALRVADEYEAAHGRGRLNDLLRRTIPDTDFDPGPLHDLMCRLPWSEILTTNFDTLIERAAERQLDRRYDVVRIEADIPLTRRPRIVKVHGSFPDSTPFVITEEDFRTYETQNKAMVNLVQLCFVENVCCLVGFSGDDPNFLRWTGWVRDVLGSSSMEPVFMVGLLDLSPAQRSLLWKRHVRTIDLSPLFPRKQWEDEGARHEAALSWFFRALDRLRPPDLSLWPIAEEEPENSSQADHSERAPTLPVREKSGLRREHWTPISIKFDDQPAELSHEDYLALSLEDQEEESLRALRETEARAQGEALHRRLDLATQTWAHNRALYPGWLVIPWRNRETLMHHTAQWVSPITSVALDVDRSRSLIWIDELTWRLDTCLRPWPGNLIDVVATIVGDEPPSNPSERERWDRLAMGLLRAFREAGAFEKFEELERRIQSISQRSREQASFIHHQATLHALGRWRAEEAKALIKTWPVDGIDPI